MKLFLSIKLECYFFLRLFSCQELLLEKSKNVLIYHTDYEQVSSITYTIISVDQLLSNRVSFRLYGNRYSGQQFSEGHKCGG